MELILYAGAFLLLAFIWAGYDELRKIRKNIERIVGLMDPINNRNKSV
jgi:hypothetical protein